MSELKSSYPSPTAAQVRGGAGPYHPTPTTEGGEQDDSHLREQLQNEIDQGNQQNPLPPTNYGQPQPEHNYPPQMYHQAYQHMPMSDAHGISPHSQQHQHAMANGDASQAKDPGVDDPAKKKTKVTRACDECRRKKIKCDAETDISGTTQCSNCKRTNSACLFSKPAQKRGPSRGYIRDLSDRVADLEQQKRAREGNSFSPLQAASPLVGLGMTGNKRTHAMSESIQNGYGGFSQNVAPQASMYGTSTSITNLPKVEFTFDEDGALSSYENSEYRWLFPPVFAQREELVRLMAACADYPHIRQGFFMALRATLLLVQNDRDPSITVFKHLVDSTIDPTLLPPLTGLAYLQSIVLTLYVLTYSGHSVMHQSYAACCSTLMGTATEIISHLKIHRMNVEQANASSEASTIYSNGRRALWALAILAQWDSFGLDRLNLVSPENLKLTMGDHRALGPIWHAMAMFTLPMNSLHTSLLKQDKSPNEVAIEVNSLNKQLELASSSLDPAVYDPEKRLSQANFPNAMFLGVKMLVSRYRANFEPYIHDSADVSTATQVIDILANVDTGDFPLSHHVAALAVRTCIEAVGYKAVKEEAKKGLENLVTAIEAGHALRHNGWKHPIMKLCKEKLNSLGGLQHLANAAVGAAEGETQKEVGVDVTSVLVEGYLKVL